MDDNGLSLDPEDFAVLDQILGENAERNDGLGLDAAHGLMTAVIVGPVRFGAEEWIPVILGNRSTDDEHDPELETLLPLLRRLHMSTRQAIEQFIFEPVLAHVQIDEEEIDIDTSGWCEGFSIGVDMCAQRWEQQIRADSTLLDLLTPIIMLGVDDGAFASIVRDSEIQPLSERERDELRQRIPGSVLDCYLYWKDHANSGQVAEMLRFEPDDIADTDEESALPPGQRLH